MYFNNFPNKKINLVFAIVIVVYAAFLFAVILYSLPNPEFSASPDGNANLAFARQMYLNHTALIPLPNDIPENLQKFLIPRSTSYSENFHSLSLMSFYGFPVLLSLFMRLVPLYIIFLFVALIAIASVSYILRFLRLEKFLFFGLLTLFVFNPFFLFYTVNGLMHNIFFLSMLLCAIAFALWSLQSGRKLGFLVTGIVLGFAGAARMNELVWILPLFVILFFIFFGKNTWKRFFLIVLGFILGLAPYLAIGYKVSQSLTQYKSTSSIVESSPSIFLLLKKFILPFGFDIWNSFVNFYQFAISVWWLTVPGIFGLFFLIGYHFAKHEYRKFAAYFAIFFTFVFLIIYYGPTATDYYSNPLLIGYSHFRYLLPVFLVLPLFGLLPLKVINTPRKNVVIFILLTLMVLPSLYYLFFSQASLQNTRQQNILSDQRFDFVKERIESNSIILAGKADKYFFPEWTTAGTIIHSKRSDFVKTLITSSVQQSVYYYHLEADISSHFTKDGLEAAGVEFIYVAQFWDGGNAWEYLYKLDWPNKNGNE